MRRRRSAARREVRFVFGACAAEGEDAGEGWDAAEDLVGLLGREVYGVVEMEGRGHS